MLNSIIKEKYEINGELNSPEKQGLEHQSGVVPSLSFSELSKILLNKLGG